MVKSIGFPLYCLNISTIGKVDKINVIALETLGNFMFRYKDEFEKGDIAKNLFWRYLDCEKYCSLFYSCPLLPPPFFTTVLTHHLKKDDDDSTLSYPWSLDSSDSFIFPFNEDIELPLSPLPYQPTLQKIKPQPQGQETYSYMHRVRIFFNGEDEDDFEHISSHNTNNREESSRVLQNDNITTTNRPCIFIPIEFHRKYQSVSNTDPTQNINIIEQNQKTDLGNSTTVTTESVAEYIHKDIEGSQKKIKLNSIMSTMSANSTFITNKKEPSSLKYSSDFARYQKRKNGDNRDYSILNDPQFLLNEAKLPFIPKLPLYCDSDSELVVKRGAKIEQAYQRSLFYLRNSINVNPLHDELCYHVW